MYPPTVQRQASEFLTHVACTSAPWAFARLAQARLRPDMVLRVVLTVHILDLNLRVCFGNCIGSDRNNFCRANCPGWSLGYRCGFFFLFRGFLSL